MKRIVITGATSMIGAALIEECLKHEIEIYAVVRKSSPKLGRLPKSARIHLVDCELEEISKLPDLIPEKCDTFYHIAWGNTGENRNKSAELQGKNIQYTMEAVNAAHALGCKKFIGAGSQAEYGLVSEGKISPETVTMPITPYGVSKLAAGRIALMMCVELGMEGIWPRIFSVYGIYEKETTMIGTSLRQMLAGEKTAFTPGMQIWDYLYSKDAGRAFYLIGEKGRGGKIYCVGSGIGRPLRSFVEQLGRMLKIDEDDLGIGAKPYPPNAVMNLWADIRSLTEDTGFVPEYPFAKGIKETIAWIQSENTGDEE